MMSKNILFLVTGMTPQIITETVWALACDRKNENQWIPDEIHVLSTQEGLTQIHSRLFADKIFGQFQKEHPITAKIKFDESCLHVIKNDKNDVLTDLKTLEDNEHAANAICDMIRTFTSQDHVTLHVSIAGGRKTMGFYAGYALSLYGRAQDRMSHVLVEEKFETARDFFYPTIGSSFVTDRFDKEWDTKDAKVWLADIPFVRLQEAVKNQHQLKSSDSFSQVVHKINESFNDVQLVIDLTSNLVVVNNTFKFDDLPAREFAFLHWFADRRKQGLDGIIASRVNASSKSKISEADRLYLDELTQQFKLYYELQKNTDGIVLDVDSKFFESVKSYLKKALEDRLGLELAAKVLIKQDKRGTPFYLDLPPENIVITDRFNK